MAGITLESAEAQLDLWIAASAAVAGNQEYEMSVAGGSRRLRRADAAEIRNMIKFWDAQVKALTPAGAGGRRRITYVVPD